MSWLTVTEHIGQSKRISSPLRCRYGKGDAASVLPGFVSRTSDTNTMFLEGPPLTTGDAYDISELRPRPTCVLEITQD